MSEEKLVTEKVTVLPLILSIPFAQSAAGPDGPNESTHVSSGAVVAFTAVLHESRVCLGMLEGRHSSSRA